MEGIDREIEILKTERETLAGLEDNLRRCLKSEDTKVYQDIAGRQLDAVQRQLDHIELRLLVLGASDDFLIFRAERREKYPPIAPRPLVKFFSIDTVRSRHARAA